MKIRFNGKEIETAAGTLAELATEKGLPEKGIAVAINGKMVRRPEWETRELQEGATVLVIRASCGG